MAKPLLCVINGPAAGAGLSLAILGDYVLAARSAHFTLAYGGVGLSPDAGATWLLPRLIGLRRAQEMAVTNRRVGAEEAAQIGLVTRVVDDEALAAEADAIAATLAATASRSIGRTRQLLLASFETSLDDADAARGSGHRRGRSRPRWDGKASPPSSSAANPCLPVVAKEPNDGRSLYCCRRPHPRWTS